MIRIIWDPLWGDGSKGADSDYFARVDKVTLGVIPNGGANRGHNVVSPDFKHHTFSLFSSCTFAGAATHIGQEVAFDPLTVEAENDQLARLGVPNAISRMSVDGGALVVTPFHQFASWIRNRDSNRSSCGMGGGVARKHLRNHFSESIHVVDLTDPDEVKSRLQDQYQRFEQEWMAVGNRTDPARYIDHLVDIYTEIGSKIRITDWNDFVWMRDVEHDNILFECGQGYKLNGVTSGNVTPDPCRRMLTDYSGDDVVTTAVFRIYSHLHGHGDLPTEYPPLKTALPEPHNTDEGRQGTFRLGWLDMVTLREVFNRYHVDTLAVSHLDYWDKLPEWKIQTFRGRGTLTEYTSFTDSEKFLAFIERELACPIEMVASGPRAVDRRKFHG